MPLYIWAMTYGNPAKSLDAGILFSCLVSLVDRDQVMCLEERDFSY